MAYNRRDLFAHWVRREQPAGKPCGHACCRGYRSHPEGYPVTLPARVLRGASDDQLAKHYAKCPAGKPRCRDQVLHELNRRDKASERREATEERRERDYYERLDAEERDAG
jgi:hypothetical protein